MLTENDRWQEPVPNPVGDLATDAAALARHAAAAERTLAALPARPDRSPEQQALAEQVLIARRRSADRFLGLHAGEVYDQLTEGRTRHLRIAELAETAAFRFPGLVPTPDEMEAERRYCQTDKEGREIDQGVFFRALLRDAVAGPHLIDAMQLPTARARKLLAALEAEDTVDLGTVLLERRGPVAHVTICNTHCLNAEDEQLVADLETAVDLVLLDARIRVGVLRGGVMTHPRYQGKRVFSAGVNLRELQAGRIGLVDFLLAREVGCLNKIARGLLPAIEEDRFPDRTIQKPWIAAVDSFAIGGGMQLLMLFDWVIAADDAWFSLPAAQEGIVPGLGNLRLGRLTGARLSRRIILGGRRIGATDPEATLVCDEVVPPDQVTEAVETAALAMDSPAVVANRRMIVLAEEPEDQFRAYLAEFALLQARRLYGTDVTDKVDRGWRSTGARA
ncbi:(3,5-dihydroxyphenyl)acetyl-CoA 1,2-dioxygenase DpgC [Streptomyces swartbergensis]|uniref:(3,5-dihydroxyphenyl)acetyl-CoA 1,2-dioxygenase DpgC n=1 Tax=Streptomyces swartbergensis TaxID=487165 RepID=UPI0038299568